MSAQLTSADEALLPRLAGVAPATPLAFALATRAEALLNAQACHDLLFQDADLARLTLQERLTIAHVAARAQGDDILAGHHQERLKVSGGPPRETVRLQIALGHARKLAAEPVSATVDDLQRLLAEGWTADAVVSLSQIVALTSFQSRYLAGLRLLGGNWVSHGVPAVEVAAGRWHDSPVTVSGRSAPTHFTRAELGWEAWLAPREAATLSGDEARRLERAGHLSSEYFMLLARDLPVLEHRTRTDMGIFYGPGGLSRAERELAATVTSKVNGCIFCASVHARKAVQLAAAAEAIDTLLAVPAGADLTAGQTPRWRALIRFAAQLAATPVALAPTHLEALQDFRFTALELLDLVGSVAFFSWANRLMLTLGEPFVPHR